MPNRILLDPVMFDDNDDVGLTPFPSGLPLRGRTRVGRRAERAARRRRTGQTRTS